MSASTRALGVVVAGLALAPAQAACATNDGAAPASPGSPAPDGARSVVGAAPPALGHVTLAGEAGLLFILPEVSLGATLGLGGGVSVELRYRNIAVLGQSGRVKVAWATPVNRHLVYAIAARSSITSLAPADGGFIGIEFSNLAVGNDWEIGTDMMLTWLRPGSAHITAALGPTWTLGGIRYTAFGVSEFQIEPAWRAVSASVQGEWEISPRWNLFLKLDGTVLVGTEIMPIGFIPTGSVGIGWPL